MGNVNTNIERAVLNAIIENESYFNEDYFEINEDYFNYQFNKMLANRLRQIISKEESVSLYIMKLENWLNTNTKHQNDYIEIIKQTTLPMGLAKKYYDDLVLQTLRIRANV